ncbi:hypothetical protein RRG08_029655 [Elysia crispata]|uniref:Uncharacterized protein n=1 Tax=Elysia crispata TaxID=231223 RepID=A0AAE0XPH7_9GAST|nr:hypothetical protein RRG08_029655 [Elysia crispata]
MTCNCDYEQGGKTIQLRVTLTKRHFHLHNAAGKQAHKRIRVGTLKTTRPGTSRLRRTCYTPHKFKTNTLGSTYEATQPWSVVTCHVSVGGDKGDSASCRQTLGEPIRPHQNQRIVPKD